MSAPIPWSTVWSQSGKHSASGAVSSNSQKGHNVFPMSSTLCTNKALLRPLLLSAAVQAFEPFMREAERVPTFFHLVSLQFFHGHLCPIQFVSSCFWICIEHASCCISLPFFGPEFLSLGTCLVGFLYVSFCHSCRQDILGMQVHAGSVPIFRLRTFPFPFWKKSFYQPGSSAGQHGTMPKARSNTKASLFLLG